MLCMIPGHLAEIPSTAEVDKEGISLGGMNAKLLKKIEELTLHLIQKDKELQNITERLNKLEANQSTFPTSGKKE